jgi:hypothetical protein
MAGLLDPQFDSDSTADELSAVMLAHENDASRRFDHNVTRLLLTLRVPSSSSAKAQTTHLVMHSLKNMAAEIQA